MNGSRGGNTGAFVRFNNGADLAYPIGMIIVPGYQQGHQVYLEGAENYVYFAKDKTQSSSQINTAATNASLNVNTTALDFTDQGDFSGTSVNFTSGKFQFGDDTDDTIGGVTNNVAGDSFFSYDVTLADPNVVSGHDGGTYTDLGRIGVGDRYHFVKSIFDWRLMGASAYSFAPQFHYGAAFAAGAGGVTIGDTALDNATYDLTVASTATNGGKAFFQSEIATNGTAQFNNGFDTKGTAGVVFNEDAQDANIRMESVNNVAMFKLDAGSDFVAIGGATQGDGLASFNVHHADVNFVAEFINSTNNGAADGVMVNFTNHADMDSGAKFYQARDSANDVMFEVQGDGSGGHTIDSSFTAGHDTACLDENELMPGLIIESTGEIWHKPSSSFSTALPFTRLSNSNGSKSVFGVISGIPLKYDATGSMVNADKGEQYVKNGYYMPPAFTRYAKNSPTGSNNRQLNTMSIGEGVMWLTNINGDIENGDYIESSVIKGYGRKQSDDILRSKTVAKATETINWSEVTSSIQYSGSAYKKHLTAVTFHCG